MGGRHVAWRSPKSKEKSLVHHQIAFCIVGLYAERGSKGDVPEGELGGNPQRTAETQEEKRRGGQVRTEWEGVKTPIVQAAFNALRN